MERAGITERNDLGGSVPTHTLGDASPPLHQEPHQPSQTLPRSISDLLPGTGFLRAYVEDAYPLSEASAEAHLLAALVTASALVGKKVRIAPWIRSSLYLVIWAVLVGVSTLARKSTTVGLAEDIIRDVEAALRLPDDTTAAALIDLLVKRDERVWFLSEFGGLIAQCDSHVQRRHVEAASESL